MTVFRDPAVDNLKKTIELLRDSAATSSIESYVAFFKNHLEISLPGFVEILKSSKSVNRVYVKIDLGDDQAETYASSFRGVWVHLLEILQIESLKHVEYWFELNSKEEWVTFRHYEIQLQFQYIFVKIRTKKVSR